MVAKNIQKFKKTQGNALARLKIAFPHHKQQEGENRNW